ncbi:MAG: (2Fe-2S)-binding protein [Rhodocyclales bacterium]|nr:(2Fe-2S)-binding protein [Rhodocyclales bacterium]
MRCRPSAASRRNCRGCHPRPSAARCVCSSRALERRPTVIVIFIEPGGTRREIEVPEGWTLMQAATANGVEGIEAECGGSCACATCHCYVEQGLERLPPPNETEAAMLENVAAERQPNSRLSCQLKPDAGAAPLCVRLPWRQS